MGNGNLGSAHRAGTNITLPTPHGEREPTAAAVLDESKSNRLSRNGRERDAARVRRPATSASFPIEPEPTGCRNRIYGGYPPSVSGSPRCVHPCSTQRRRDCSGFPRSI